MIALLRARSLAFVISLPMLVALSGCGSSTSILRSWHDPAVTVTDGAYNKVLVIGLIKDEATRRASEDRMAAFMNGHGVVSYAYLGADVETINEEGMNARMVMDGIDAVLIMRLLDRTKEQTYVPGTVYPTYYRDPWSYYGYSYSAYHSPGYVQTDITYTVETNLYGTSIENQFHPVRLHKYAQQFFYL